MSVEDNEKTLWQHFKDEFIILVKLAIPAITGQSAFFIMTLVDTIFIGRIGELELAGGALGSSWSVCLNYIPVGMACGMDTLVSQAFGAGNMPLIGVWFQCSLWVSSVASIPVMVCLWYTEEIMIALGQDLVVSHLAGVYCKWLVPGILPFIIFHCQLHWLQNQQIMAPSTIIAVIGIVLNIPLNYVFIWGAGSWPGWGLEGAAIATSLLRLVMPILTWIYVVFRGLHKPTTPTIYRDSFRMKYIVEFIKYGLPSMLMILFEIAGIEGSTFLVGLLQDPVALAAHGIGLYILLLCFILPFGWGIAANIHLGNLVGAGEEERAKRVAVFSLMIILADVFVVSIILWSIRTPIVSIWTTEKKVIELASTITAILSLCIIFDGYQFTSGSLIKAIGRQYFGAVVHFVAFYILTLPCAYVFASILGYGVISYWWSLAVGLCTLGIGFTFILLRVNWKEEVELAKKRTGYEIIRDTDSLVMASRKGIHSP